MKTKSQLKVCDKQCDECLFTKNKIVTDKRRDELLSTVDARTDYFICHKASIVGEKVMCRGFYEKYGNVSILISLGKSLNLISFVDVMEIMRNKLNKIRSRRKLKNK